jgi:hypothetical protein
MVADIPIMAARCYSSAKLPEKRWVDWRTGRLAAPPEASAHGLT